MIIKFEATGSPDFEPGKWLWATVSAIVEKISITTSEEISHSSIATVSGGWIAEALEIP